jgi:hypothetical protein
VLFALGIGEKKFRHKIVRAASLRPNCDKGNTAESCAESRLPSKKPFRIARNGVVQPGINNRAQAVKDLPHPQPWLALGLELITS